MIWVWIAHTENEVASTRCGVMVLAAWAQRMLNHLATCLSWCCQLFQGHWNSKSDVEVRWGHGNVLCNLSPFYQSFWWGFHFRFPVRKRARCKIIGFWVWFMCNSWWVTHAGFLFYQPGCLENPSGWGQVAICFSFTYQDAHLKKWWTPMEQATAGRRSSLEKQHTLEWVSGLPPRWWFLCD